MKNTKLCECGCGNHTPLSKKTDYRTGALQGQPARFCKGHNKCTHRMFGTHEHRAYHQAKGRCINPRNRAWKDYGGRGIKFLFSSFEQFFTELGRCPKRRSLDRINNNGNYEPGNVRWATNKQQAHNKRSLKGRPWSIARRAAQQRRTQ